MLKAAAIGEWTYYLSYHDATHCIPVGKSIYALYAGNLLIYDTEDGAVTTPTKLDGLSEKQIVLMQDCQVAQKVVLVYNNGNIDLLHRDGTIENMPQYKNKHAGSSLNDLSVVGNDAFLATSEGIVHINVKQAEFTGFYTLKTPIYSATMSGNVLYAATDAGVYRCDITENPLDVATWSIYNTTVARQLIAMGDHLYLNTAKKGIYLLSASNPTPQQLIKTAQTSYFADSKGIIFYNKTSYTPINSQTPTSVASTVTLPSSTNAICRTTDGTLWMAQGFDGLNAYKATDSGLQATTTGIGSFGPKRDLCYFLRYAGERLLVAGGRLDPFDLSHYPGTSMYYEKGAWTIFEQEGIAEHSGGKYQDLTSIIQHPDDPTQHTLTSARVGLFHFKDGKYAGYHSLDNSPLVSAAANSKNYVRTDGLQYDHEGNLWMVNNQVDSVIIIRMKDGSWRKLFYAPLEQAPTLATTLFDRKGRFWICSRRTVNYHNGGLMGIDYAGTIDTQDDDYSYYRSHITNQDGTSYKFEGVQSIAEDHDGRIWVGTDIGLFVIDNPDEWFNDDFRITQVKVPRNDGTNLADYLLYGMPIISITVDGANRKWIGTSGNGVYLVSASGQEILHHFTSENSPLLSNNVTSIAIHPRTGEVMMGTDGGLVSYQSDATSPSETLSEGTIQIFPNPVRPEYHGNVTITGLTTDADIKIVTSGGQLVATGTSMGGTWQWDGRNFSGGYAGSGIYYVLIATADGNTTVAGMLTVIR
jgi:hypothetical protein